MARKETKQEKPNTSSTPQKGKVLSLDDEIRQISAVQKRSVDCANPWERKKRDLFFSREVSKCPREAVGLGKLPREPLEPDAGIPANENEISRQQL